ncbi:MAG TPA: hypothetical protein VGG30_09120 [Pirellulales bacterium]|jgi:hypothetical protein
MSTTLKNLKSKLFVLAVAGALAPQVASAHGGGGHMSAPPMSAPHYAARTVAASHVTSHL